MLTDPAADRTRTLARTAVEQVMSDAACPFCQRLGLGTEWITSTDQRTTGPKIPPKISDILVVTCPCGFRGSRLVQT